MQEGAVGLFVVPGTHTGRNHCIVLSCPDLSGVWQLSQGLLVVDVWSQCIAYNVSYGSIISYRHRFWVTTSRTADDKFILLRNLGKTSNNVHEQGWWVSARTVLKILDKVNSRSLFAYQLKPNFYPYKQTTSKTSASHVYVEDGTTIGLMLHINVGL